MKRMILFLTAAMLNAAPALASGEPEATGTSLFVLLFLVFGALIVAFQLIPSLILFSSMLKGLFGSAVKHPLPKSGARIP